jgi:alanyl-tRNA synthetase
VRCRTAIRPDFGEIYRAGKVLHNIPAKELKPLVDEEKRRVGSGVAAFVTVASDERASIIVGVLGGKGGGGRRDMAQAGGPDGAQAEAALAAVEAALAAA